MRSRFAAFALGLGGYLVRTLAADHPDLSIPHDALARELGRVRERQRFLGLRILDEITRGEDGDVVFLARIFERGADRSFAEVSTFRRESGGWRYASGLLVPRSGLPTDLAAVTHDDVRAAARGGGASSDCR
jgi:SEC-C motif-containing protein